MSSIERSMSADAINATRSRHGEYAAVVAAELAFGSPVREDPSAAGEPDTLIEYDAGPGVLVQTSIDNGANWSDVARSGQRIPGLGIGDSLVNGALRTRVVLDPRRNSIVTRIHTRVVLEDGTVLDRDETGAALGDGKLVGVRFNPFNNRITRQVNSQLRFFDDGVAFYEQLLPEVLGPERELQLSRGGRSGLRPGNSRYSELQDTGALDEDEARERFKLAACGFEAVLHLTDRSAGPLRYICSWMTAWYYSNEREGVSFYLDENNRFVLRILAPTSAFTQSGAQYDELKTSSFDDDVIFDRHLPIAWSYDGYWAEIYVNNTLVARRAFEWQYNKDLTVGQVGVVFAMDRNFYLGNNYERKAALRGDISEVKVFKRRITPGGLQQRARRRLNDNAPLIDALYYSDNVGLVAYWPMTPTTGFAVDLTPLGDHDLTLLGSARYVSTFEPWYGVTAPDALGSSVPTRAGYRISDPQSLVTTGNTVRVSTAPFNLTFPDGRSFLGVGKLGRVSQSNETADIDPTHLSLELSGIDPVYLATMFNVEYLDRPARVYVVLIDMSASTEASRVVVDPIELWAGIMDTMQGTMTHEEVDDGDSLPVMTITVNCTSDLVVWDRPRGPRWTDKVQRARYPNDRGLSLLADTAKKKIWWPAQFTNVDESPSEG